jgi:hypothetical protein
MMMRRRTCPPRPCSYADHDDDPNGSFTIVGWWLGVGANYGDVYSGRSCLTPNQIDQVNDRFDTKDEIRKRSIASALQGTTTKSAEGIKLHAASRMQLTNKGPDSAVH